MSKLKIIKKNSVKNINNEKKFLSMLNNPFLVNMICSFQDNENLYLVMDLLLGGDMRYHINKKAVYNRKNDENQLKFIAGCVLVGLNYIHEKQIIHKDIKPENLVFDSRGYIHITDFGISKIYHPDNGKENSGTPGYMAPEVLFNKDHNFSVDYFSLGVILYELLMGRRPYHGHSKKELRKDVVSRQAKIKEDNIPDGLIKSNKFSLCADFINKLLERKKEKRLGYMNFKEIKDHPWLIDFNWDELITKKMQPYFVPPVSDSNYDKKYCNEPEKIGDETQKEYESIKNKYDYNKLFLNYSSNNKSFLEKININMVNEQKKNKINIIEKEKKEQKNIFGMKKDINLLLKDTKILRALFKKENKILSNNNIIKKIINQDNERRNGSIKTLKVKDKIKGNTYNDISLSTTKNNSNLSTNNIISDYYPIYNKDNNKFKSYNYKYIKDESNFNHTNFQSTKIIHYFKNRSQFDFYKKNTQKKLPFIYKHLKKSISVENIHKGKPNNNVFGILHKNEQKNPISLYEKYFPLRRSSVNFQYKNPNSYINNYI